MDDQNDTFRIMSDASPLMIWVTDPEGRIRFVNRAYSSFFGKNPDTAHDEPWEPLVHPDDRAAYTAVFATALKNRTGFDAMARVCRADNRWRWVHSYAAPYYSSSGEFLGMVGSSPDVTEQVQAQHALEQSERLFRNLADNAPVVIWMCDTDGRCTFMSKGWQTQTGQAPEQAHGDGWLKMIHPEDRRTTVTTFHAAVKGRERYECEYRLRTPEASYRIVLDAAAPRLDDDGEFLGYIGSVLDITERKRHEEALRAADRQKDAFLAVLAHELRNPLGPVANAVEILRHKALPPDARSATNIIGRQVVHLRRLVDDLLDVARLANGKIVLQRDVITIQSVVAAALESIQARVESQGHELVVEEPTTSLWVDADLTRLTQVLVNLLGNAIKYTRPGGHIRLSVRGTQCTVEVHVQDDGIGIAPDILPKVFDMFTQADSTLSRAEGGLGIGLALSKGIVTLHGGALTARSEGVGKGSEFVMALQRANPRVEEQPERLELQKSVTRKRVLVVDDNVDSANTLVELLQLLGHDGFVAHSGEAGLDAARAIRPDVVILDIAMPGMNGYQVAEELRREPWAGEVTLVALTGFGQAEDRERAQGAGFHFHLTKPAGLKELLSVLGPRATTPEGE